MLTSSLSRGPEIYRALLKAFTQGPAEVISLFHEEAVIEYPYIPGSKTVARLDKAGLYTYLAVVLPFTHNRQFTGIKVYAAGGGNNTGQKPSGSL
jgi:hypothetical protein